MINRVFNTLSQRQWAAQPRVMNACGNSSTHFNDLTVEASQQGHWAEHKQGFTTDALYALFCLFFASEHLSRTTNKIYFLKKGRRGSEWTATRLKLVLCKVLSPPDTNRARVISCLSLRWINPLWERVSVCVFREEGKAIKLHLLSADEYGNPQSNTL